MESGLLGDCGAHENAKHTRKNCSFFSITCPSLYGRSLSELIKEELERDIAPPFRQDLIQEKHVHTSSSFVRTVGSR